MPENFDRHDSLPRGVAIAANPYSGAKENRRLVEQLAAELCGLGLEPKLMWQAEELAEAAAGADFAARFRCLVAAGGDGTLNRVINQQTTLPVVMFPLGNENLFAQQFGSSNDPQAAARSIVACRTRTIDLGKAGWRKFAAVASAGFDADVVHRLTRWRQQADRLRRVRSRSYFPMMLAAAVAYSHPMMEIEADGRRLAGPLVLISNFPRYAAGLRLSPDARDDDGLLDWVVFQRPGSLRLMRYGLSVLLRRHLGRGDVQHGRARRITLNCSEPVPLEVDGEEAGFAPLDIEVLPAALGVVLPV